jgi:hypothetical protein
MNLSDAQTLGTGTAHVRGTPVCKFSKVSLNINIPHGRFMTNHKGKICDNCGDSVDRLVPLNDPTRIGRWWCLKCIYKEGKAKFDADAKND